MKTSTQRTQRTQSAQRSQRHLPDWRSKLPDDNAVAHYFARIKDRNSSRVLGFSLNEPNIALVTVCELSFSTPRITMQRCLASTTTPTPSGVIFCWIAFAI